MVISSSLTMFSAYSDIIMGKIRSESSQTMYVQLALNLQTVFRTLLEGISFNAFCYFLQ